MKSITIGGVTIPVVANAATSFYHQRIFKEDCMRLLNKYANKKEDTKGEKTKEEEEAEDEKVLDISRLFERLAFTMAMQAEHAGHEEALLVMNDVDFANWLSQFEDPMAVLNATSDISRAYYSEDKPTAEEKKDPAPQTES